jgi:hypothetical protein
MNETTKTALAVCAVVALAAAFWLLLLAPKREKAAELSKRANAISAEVGSEQQRAAEALTAKEDFPRDYQRLIILGKAVPAEAATPSLLVQLDGVSALSRTVFTSIEQGEGGEATESTEGAETSAALLPLGSSVGPAGFSKMPYKLKFDGYLFNIAGFIRRLDSLVQTKDGFVDSKGRLVTIDGFNLRPAEGEGAGSNSTGLLEAEFIVSTYVTPPGQGLTAGASPSGPPETTVDLP